jgi:heme-degrading monooxygenase HmoA
MAQEQGNEQVVTQITIVDTEPDRQEEALSLMNERAHFMASQPGFISINLYRSVDGRRIINHIRWQNQELLRSAHRSPAFRDKWGQFPQLADDIDPHLYETACQLG